jgi:predicted RND superfamily exporter protein
MRKVITCDAQAGPQCLEDFDKQTGSLPERLLFNNRKIVLSVFLLITLILGYQATKIRLNAGFEKMIPTSHPYIANFLENRDELTGLGNGIRIAVETTEGTILNADYLEELRKINDDASFLPGADLIGMRSIWTPSTLWFAVTEDGLSGGPVMGSTYDGSPEEIDLLRANIERSGQIGQLIAKDFKSSVVFAPLLDTDPQTGEALDYSVLSEKLEQLRSDYQKGPIKIHITGFAKIVGDLIEGLQKIFIFFGVAVLIAGAVLYWYTRCTRCTVLVVTCSLMAVVWQTGILATLGYGLDPYSILVPFLIFSIGMSHGAQKMNGILLDIGRGSHKIVAARLTFRRLFVAGLTALLSDAAGFAVLMLIDIQVIQELAIAASIGVGVLIITNLVVIPIVLSFTGVCAKAAARSVLSETQGAQGKEEHRLWRFLDLFTQRKWAITAIAICSVLAVIGMYVRSDLQIGDLDRGAPELRPDSRYNLDNAYMNQNYGASSDVLVVMVKTPQYEGSRYNNVMHMAALETQLRRLPGVEAAKSFASLCKRGISGYNEGNLKWHELIPNQSMLNSITTRAPRDLFSEDCDLLSIFVFLEDHKAETLTRVVDAVEEFAAENNTEKLKFLLAAGSAGIEAATNIVVKKAMNEMLFYVYGVVIILCLITFRSIRAVLCAVIPLLLTSVLCEVLMVWMGIGVKVATLPVIALGVGVGVDYALYVLSVMLDRMREGSSLADAYYLALKFTGKVVVLIGITLAMAVGTWIFSPIKFQADMGILLCFMFLWNMAGALILLPALAHFILKKELLSGKKAKDPEPLQADFVRT